MLLNRIFGGLVAGLGLLGLGCHDVELDFDRAEAGEIVLPDDLYSISAVDPEHAVAVGYYGAAYFTEDGGQSWRQGKTGTRESLYNVSMADTQHGWAVGQRALVLRTEDGGRNWTQQANPKQDPKLSPHFFSVAAIDPNTAWITGEWGTRILTRDGGKTWQDDSFTVDEMHPQFVWLDQRDQEKVRRGEPVFEDVTLNDIYCERGDPDTVGCWFIGEFGYVFYSHDGGQNWIPSTIAGSATMPLIELDYNEIEIGEEDVATIRIFANDVAGEEHLNVAIESVASPEEIEAFGRGGDPNEFFELLEARAQDVRTALEDADISTDRIRMRAQPPWDYEDYLNDDPDFLERYFRGRQNDVPGVAVRVIQNPILFTVNFDDDGNGLIAGLGGVILVTKDGGETWSYRNMDLSQAVFSATAVPGRALAVGEKGFVRVSTDGGTTWEHFEDARFPSIFTFMRDVGFAPGGQTGYIVGQTGTILKSIDAGKNWEQVLPVVEPPTTPDSS